MAEALILFVAAQHIAFMMLEMFLWEHPLGRKVFHTSEDFARQSSTLAANQGLYNGFLAAGLIYGHLLGAEGLNIVLFMLVCVVVAGIFGGITVSRSIFFIQSLPAVAAILLLLA